MNKIQELAYRNVKKYKKHYLFVSILVFCVSLFFLSSTIIYNNYYEVEKNIRQQQYGEWYFKTNFTLEYKEGYEKAIKKQYTSGFESYYIYNQGTLGDYKIGYVDQEIYDFCKLDLIEGHYPEASNEIMVSTVYQNDKHINVGDDLELTLFNTPKVYKVVGIIKNSQEDYFLDIYTHKDNLTEVDNNIFKDIPNYTSVDVFANRKIEKCYFGDGYSEYSKIQIYDINPYGYMDGQLGMLEMSKKQITILAEALLLTIFALLALNSTSLKRRSKEFALLRGIGMTNKQLFSMVLYEIVYTVVISVILGFALSFGIAYIGSLVLDKMYGVFVYSIQIKQLLFYVGLLMGSIVLSMLYPIYSSSKAALTGTFDSAKFKYIQVRYRELKYQTNFRLALRELMSFKKMPFFLIAAFCLLSLLYITSSIDLENVQYWGDMKYTFQSFQYYEDYNEDIDIINKNFDNYEIFEYAYSNDLIINQNNNQYRYHGDIYKLSGFSLDKCIIEGRLPTQDNEVLISFDNLSACFFDEETHFSANYEVLKVNDKFMYEGKEYTVVGSFVPNETKHAKGYYNTFELFYAPNGIYFIEDEFHRLYTNSNCRLRLYFHNKQEGKTIYDKYFELFPNTHYISYSAESLESAYGSPEEILTDIDPEILILPLIVGFIFVYYLNKNHMMNNSQDIALFKLLGMTNKDIYIKQVYKALLLVLALVVFNVFWILMLNVYYNIVFIPVVEFMIIVIVSMIVFITVYCLPMKNLLNNNVFDLIKGDE